MKKLFFTILILSVGFVVNAFSHDSDTVLAQNYVKQICGNCSGSGAIFIGYNAWGYPQYQKCPVCEGYGFVLIPVDNINFGKKASCNLPSHSCAGFLDGTDGPKDNYCDRCAANGYPKCHSVIH